MNCTLNLTDGTVVEMEAATSIGQIQVRSADKAAMVATWDKLTEDNLAAVQIKNGDGIVTGNYNGLLLDSETSAIQSDGSILTTYHLRPKTDVELLTKRMAEIEEGQQVQDGAINDIATVTGQIAEQMAGQEGGQA